MNKKTEEYIEKLKELLLKSAEISTFYGKVLDSRAAFLSAHGIKASDEELKTAQRLVNEFKELKSEATCLESELFNKSKHT